MNFRIVVEQRLTATMLAIRWYAVEHDGKLPTRLDDLVPRYLPAVPIDALADGGMTILYRPDSANPIVYSVGENGIDDGGSEQSSNPRFRGRVSEWDMKDRVVHLTRQPRPPPETDEPDDSAATRPTTRE